MSLTLWERTTRTGIPFWHDSNSALFIFSNFWSKDCTCKQVPLDQSAAACQSPLDCNAGPLQPGAEQCSASVKFHLAAQQVTTSLQPHLTGALVAAEVSAAAASVQEPFPLILVVLIPAARQPVM